MKLSINKMLGVAAAALIATTAYAGVIGSGNTYNPATDEIGIARDGVNEGYVTWDSFRSEINAQLPDKYVTSGTLGATGITLTFTNGAPDVLIPFTPTDMANMLAGDADAMQALAEAIISPDARNTVFITVADGLIAENDAVAY